MWTIMSIPSYLKKRIQRETVGSLFLEVGSGPPYITTKSLKAKYRQVLRVSSTESV